MVEPVVVVMVEPPETIVPIKGEVAMADKLPAPAPPAKIVLLPTVVVMVEPPEVIVETMAEVVIADEVGVTPGPV